MNRAAVLPLKANARIAVGGPNAALLQCLDGNYNGAAVAPILPVDGMRVPIPETYLKPAENSGEHGLKGEYFDNLSFSGAPRLTRVDPVVNFNFEHSAPSGFTPGRFSVRWSAILTDLPPFDDYAIGSRTYATSRGRCCTRSAMG